MSDRVYQSQAEVLEALQKGDLTVTQAAAWIEGFKARDVGFKIGVTSGNKVSLRCKGTNGQFGQTLHTITLVQLMRHAAQVKQFLAANLHRLEPAIRPQDMVEIEAYLTEE